MGLCLLGWTASAGAQSATSAAFVTNYGGDSVSSFIVGDDGSLTLADTVSVGDAPQTISITPDGRFLAVAHGTANAVSEELRILEVNSDATLTERSVHLVPDSPLDLTWLSNDVLAVTETDFSVSRVRTFRYDASVSFLSVIDEAVSGGFNSRLASARDNSLLFANNTLGGNSIYSYSVNANGELTTIDNESTSPLFAVDLAASRDGNHLYGAGGISGDDNRVLGFSIAADGSLSPLPEVSYTSGGDSPKVLALTANDEILIAGHGGDGSMHSFLRDTTTGALTATGFSYSVGGQGDLGDLVVVDDIIFVTDEDSFDSPSGLLTVRVNPDGSFTDLSGIVPTGGSRPEYIATWTVSSLNCDFDLNGECDIADLDALLAEGPIADSVAVTPGVNDQFDLNGDGQIDLSDLSAWLASAASENGLGSPYIAGDANLDGFVDASDFNIWNTGKFTVTTAWSAGDFSGDGLVDTSDFNIWNNSKFMGSDQVVSVPEPQAALLLILGLMLCATLRRSV